MHYNGLGMACNLNELKTTIMSIDSKIRDIMDNHIAHSRIENGKDLMCDIYVDDFIKELLSKFELFAIPVVSNSEAAFCKCPFCTGDVKYLFTLKYFKCSKCKESFTN